MNNNNNNNNNNKKAFFAKRAFYKPKNVQVSTPDSYMTNEYRQRIRDNSYLGKKGYTIPKENLVKEDLDFLYKDLFCKPMTFGPAAAAGEDAAFPVYRENTKKIYIPRFYGIERYGLPGQSEIISGKPIDVPFDKQLRDYQEQVIDIYKKTVSGPIHTGSDKPGGGGIIELRCGMGKCLGKDTPVLMYDGTLKLVQDISVDDVLMGDDSTKRNITSLARGRETMYRVSDLSSRESYVVNESHILSLKLCNHAENTPPERQLKDTVVDMTVLEYLSLSEKMRNALYGYRVPIRFEGQRNPSGSVPNEVGYNCLRESKVADLESVTLVKDSEGQRSPSGSLPSAGNQVVSQEQDSELDDMYAIGYSVNTYGIPHEYKCGPLNTRLELLAGIIDSIGSYCFTYYEIINKKESVLDDIVYLARSIGLVAFKESIELSENCYIARIAVNRYIYIPVKLPERKASMSTESKDLSTGILNYRIKVEKLEEDDYYGFEIDGNRRFVLGDFTVTHNTVIALKIISLLKQKTLVIVHKEFLMNQWIERISEFLPGAKVGKIQGALFDVDGKDIVLGMVQTLYNRPFADNAFSDFGLTIIDEVHRIGSEEFSKTLLRIITPYMLGISATVERKDKLTKLLYMFIGPKLFSSETKSDDLVCVRQLEYCSTDEEFNAPIHDYKGNVMYSSMVSKLCSFSPRNEFIIRIIRDLLIESPDSQIMILGHQRNLLTYLFDSITHHKIATVGYYVGGMKQAKLNETESKQVVLATYSMASEGLDIKSLSTLMLITPKTDIIQCVGRILRMKHEQPIVVDIVDRHDIFQNQWRQRKSYYKKCNYNIRFNSSTQYKGFSDLDNWKLVYARKPDNGPSSSSSCISGVLDTKLENVLCEVDEDKEDEYIAPAIKNINTGKCMIQLDDADLEREHW